MTRKTDTHYVKTTEVGNEYVKFSSFIEIRRIHFDRQISKDDTLWIRMTSGKKTTEMAIPITQFISPRNQLNNIVDANTIVFSDKIEIRTSAINGEYVSIMHSEM